MLPFASHHGPILKCASLSHTHFWYEVGMLNVPEGYQRSIRSFECDAQQILIASLNRVEHMLLPVLEQYILTSADILLYVPALHFFGFSLLTTRGTENVKRTSAERPRTVVDSVITNLLNIVTNTATY